MVEEKMPNLPELFKGMKIRDYYRYILYVSGVILIFSLFFETKGLDNLLVIQSSIVVIIAGLFTWFIDTIFGRTGNNLHEVIVVHERDNEKYWKYMKILSITNYLLQLIIWIFVAYYLLSRIII